MDGEGKHDSGGMRVLVVEDTRLQALVLKMALEKLGFATEVAGNGREALARLEERHFPLVVTDWMMPEMDGVEFCREVRAGDFGGYIYTILLTAKEATEDVVRGLEAGADDYLIKPIDHGELAARLKTGQRIFALEQALLERNAEIERLSHLDPLTGVFNRRYFDAHLAGALKRSIRYRRPLSFVIADIDHFKRVNDTYGHQAGDKVLKEFTRYLAGSIRQDIDSVARYGGEEFAILLPETGLDGARCAVERFRGEVESMAIVVGSKEISITASFGIASLEEGGGATINVPDNLIRAADEQLYKAKKGGRNRVEAVGLGLGQSVIPRRF